MPPRNARVGPRPAGTAAGTTSKPERIYRDAGGANAVLANVAVDLAERPQSSDLAAATDVALVCPPDEARRRLKRIDQLGFDEVLLVSHYLELEEIERARDFL